MTGCFTVNNIYIVVRPVSIQWKLDFIVISHSARNRILLYFDLSGFNANVECKLIPFVSGDGVLSNDVLLLILVWLTHNKPFTVYPKNMHTVFALLCFVVVIHWLIFPYPSGLLYWHCGNLTIAPVPAKQPWRIWINTSCEFITNDCITTTKQSTTKPCAYFLGYTVRYHACRTWLSISEKKYCRSMLERWLKYYVDGTNHYF